MPNLDFPDFTNTVKNWIKNGLDEIGLKIRQKHLPQIIGGNVIYYIQNEQIASYTTCAMEKLIIPSVKWDSKDIKSIPLETIFSLEYTGLGRALCSKNFETNFGWRACPWIHAGFDSNLVLKETILWANERDHVFILSLVSIFTISQ